MADVFTAQKRSEVMSRIRGKGNRSTEIKFIEALRRGGLKGWRRNSSLPGRPDFVFSARRVAIFLDGCFWHACPKHYRPPTTNVAFWKEKIARNKWRDRKAGAEVRSAGWTVLRIWEHDLRNAKLAARSVERVRRMMRYHAM